MTLMVLRPLSLLFFSISTSTSGDSVVDDGDAGRFCLVVQSLILGAASKDAFGPDRGSEDDAAIWDFRWEINKSSADPLDRSREEDIPTSHGGGPIDDKADTVSCIV